MQYTYNLRKRNKKTRRRKIKRGGGKWGNNSPEDIPHEVIDSIEQLKKCDLHVHMGGACTKVFLQEHLHKMHSLCNESENGRLLKEFLDKTLIHPKFKPMTYLDYIDQRVIFKNEYKDLDDFRSDYDMYSDVLKILCGASKPSFIYTKNKFNVNECLNLDEGHKSPYGTMGFLHLVFDNFREEQQKHGCVALEISQTPFGHSEDGELKNSKYFEAVTQWQEKNTDFPIAFISTCIRGLPNQFGGPLNTDIVNSLDYPIVKAIGVASSEKPTVDGYLAGDSTVTQNPYDILIWLDSFLTRYSGINFQHLMDRRKELLNATYRRIGDTSPIPSQLPNSKVNLIPHVGEEYYGENGDNSLESVNAYLHFNEPNITEKLGKNGVSLGFNVIRLGHACQCGRSQELLDKLEKQQMVCEICLTSNDKILSTKVNEDGIFKEPPVISMVKNNVPFVICSDDPAIFTQGDLGCILNFEYGYLYKLLKIEKYSDEDAFNKLREVANRSIEQSLALSSDQKERYIIENSAINFSTKEGAAE